MFIAGQEKDGATMFAQDITGFAQYFEYDVFNQMIKSSTGTSSGEYTYYGDGQRATATTNGKTSRFIYEASQVTLELDSKGNQSARNIYGNNLVTRNAGGQSVYYMYNGHADVTALLKTDGTIMATYQYDAFGNALDDTTKANLKDIENPYTYGGYRFDDESGLYYLNARYYDPATARFMSEDTYSGDPNDPLSLNLYTYCSNNPIAYTDPTGHWKESDKNLLPDARIAIARLTDIYCSTTDPEVKTRCFNESNAIRNNVDNQTTYPQNSALGALYDKELSKDGSVSASDWLRISNTLYGDVSPGAINTINGAQNMVDEYYKQKQIDKAFDSVYNDLDVNRSKSTNNFNNSDTGSAFAKGSSSISKGMGNPGEMIVISGSEYQKWYQGIPLVGDYIPGGRFKYTFIEPAIKQLRELKVNNSDNTITWMVSSTGYSKSDRKNIENTAKKIGVKIVWFDDKDEFINYINTGSIDCSKSRGDMKISSITTFSHGLDGILALGYNQDDEDDINIAIDDLFKINKGAFSSDVTTMLYSCNAGTPTKNNGISFAQAWANATGGTVKGAIGRTDYVPTVGDWSLNEKTIEKRRKEKGYMDEGSYQYPSLGNGAEWKVFTPQK